MKKEKKQIQNSKLDPGLNICVIWINEDVEWEI